MNLGRAPATGKRKQQWVSVKGTKKEAAKRLAELLHQLDTGSFMKPGKTNVADFLQRWLQDYFLEAAKDSPYYALFYTNLFTGMRRSELLALRWQDIDFLYG